MKRRKSSAEFKRKVVVVEAIRGQQTAREIAARHGLNPNQVARWKSEGMDGLRALWTGSWWRRCTRGSGS